MTKESLISRICNSNLCESLGKNNKATYAVMVIAAVKGVCRPIFTMMDKKQDPETKKYTAIREGLTEVIAIPTYFACGEIAAKIAKALPKDLQTKADKNFMFLGVCTAAIFIIPALCSVAIKPIMEKIQANAKKKHELQNPTVSAVTHNPVQPVQNQQAFGTFSSFTTRPHYGMRVGGV